MTKRFLRYSGLGLAVLTVGAIAACGSTDSSGGPGSAGSNNSAGAHTGGATGLPGGAGQPAIAGGNSAGANTGGGASAGAPGTAGNGAGGAGAGYPCAGAKPASATITEFADLVANATSAGNYNFMAGVPGGTFTYQPAALTLATTGMALNIKGNVKNYDGFGVYFTSCTDASAYTGVSFSIKGSVGATGTLNFRVQTNADTAVDAVNKKGSCVPTDLTDTYPSCHASGFDIPVTSSAATVTVNFSQLTGGLPTPAVTGADIVGLEWAFSWTPPAAGTGGAGGAAGGGAYDADVTIDDIKFIGGSVGGAGGAGGGGASGSANGGAGGSSAGAGGSSAGAGGSAGAKGGAGGSAGS